MHGNQEKGHPAREEPLPTLVEEITADWLTRTLRLEYPALVVNRMTVVELIQGHTTKLRVSLDLNQAGIDAGIPDRLCLKANLTGSPLSSAVNVNEARFYKEFRNRMDLPAPVCFFADWDDGAAGQQGLIVLEEMALRGGGFDTSFHAIGIDDMARSLTALAGLHGRTWNHPELHRHEWLQTAMAPETATDDYWSMMETYFAAHNRIPARLAMFPTWMAEDTDRLRAAFRQLCAQEMRDPSPLCLVHGDSHLGNTWHGPGGERLWFDWQIVRKGRPWRDYSYFVIGSITIEDRRKAERDLLRHYLDELAKHGPVIPFDRAWDDYRRWVIWGLIAWQSNINPREETMVPLERFCRAADDLETARFFDL